MQILAEVMIGVAVIVAVGFLLRRGLGYRPSRFANVIGVIAASVLLALIGQNGMANNLIGAPVLPDLLHDLWIAAAMFGGAILLTATL